MQSNPYLYITHTGKDISRLSERPFAADLVSWERNENIFSHKGRAAYKTLPTFVDVCHRISSQSLLQVFMYVKQTSHLLVPV